MKNPARLLRFLLVGGAFAGGYAIASALLTGPGGFPVYATSVILYALCIPLAFLIQMRVTFGLTQTRAVGFPIYAATQVTSLAVVTAITTRFVSGHFIADTLVFLASAGIAAVLSFAISSKFAFRPKV
ncbi:GtrA family protein [Gymnodinialimonas sp. 2305UL16-5]